MENWHEKLDDVLLKFKEESEQGFISELHLPEFFNKKYTTNELDILIDFLVECGFVTSETFNVGSDLVLSLTHYKLSLKGYLFLEKNSFKKEQRANRAKRHWIIAKTIIVYSNGVVILVLTWLGISINDKTNTLQNELLKKQLTIDSLIKVNTLIKPVKK